MIGKQFGILSFPLLAYSKLEQRITRCYKDNFFFNAHNTRIEEVAC